MIRENIELIIKILTVVVAIFSVWKYFSDRAINVETEKNARALAYLEAYAAPDLVNARKALFDFWSENQSFIHHVYSNGIDARSYAIFARISLNEYPKANDLQTALFNLANYYDQVWHCRNTKLCSAEVLDDYFCQRSVLQSAAYAPFLIELGKASGFETFGEGLINYGAICVMH